MNMNNKLQTLANAIHIHNEYNKIAAPIVEYIKGVCKTFVGKKVQTQKGLSSKFYDVVKVDKETIKVNPIPGTKWAKVHFISVQREYNDIFVEISLCFANGKEGCVYEKNTWYIGKIDDNGILLSVNDNCKVPVLVLDLETELQAIKELRKAEKAVEIAKEKININHEAYKYIDFEEIDENIGWLTDDDL